MIHLQFGKELESTAIRRIENQTFDDYGTPRPITSGEFKLQLGPEAASAATKHELDGWRYDSKDGSRVLQLRRGSVTCNVLRGYTNWLDFKVSASNVWRRLCDLLENIVVSRLAVRYINVIPVPRAADFDEYLAAGPRIPPHAPQLLNGFLQRVEIPFAEAEAIAIVTQVLEAPNQTSVPVVLDIDVQAPATLYGHSDEIWVRLDKLRNIKNLLFFSSLTERALELFQ